ncbi:MAG: FAD-dependent oxidoreductase [Cyanobacteriota bacterium]|jgi:choline dehydrogenase-like flavoprotein
MLDPVSTATLTLADAARQCWDVIIIGGGMGGSSVAYSLSQAGHRVLLLEKGRADCRRVQGVQVEQEKPEERLKNGKWPNPLTTQVDHNPPKEFWAPLGCGLGGSTLLYAAALQRLRPSDFDCQTLPDGRIVSWPFKYEEIEPYYLQAESLFSVCGTEDPLDQFSHYQLLTPPAMCEVDQHFFSCFENVGLHPYRLHVGIKYKPGCEECAGYVCPLNCKQDAYHACILPALATGQLFLVEQAEVIRLEANESRIQAVIVRQEEQEYCLTASIFVLACGAYFTPILLQSSANESWPQGIANSSGLVGRNLMFHSGEMIALWSRGHFSRIGPNKTLALRDFYCYENQKLGEIQSTGRVAGYGNILYALRLMFDQTPFSFLPLVRQLLRIPAFLASKLLGEATIFTTIVEDFPYPDNQICLDPTTPSGLRIEYQIRNELRQRVILLRQLFRQSLASLLSLPLGAGIFLNYGHPCGTCQSGEDSQTSVLNRDCRSHDIENLYVVDASFMPTSGGTNPSLTIAANALRVGDKIHQHLLS